MAEMNRLALLIPLLATCSSTGLRSHVPDAGFSNNDGVEGLQPEAGSPVAEIIETASANRAGFDVLVYSDGSATQTTVPSSGCPFLGADDTNCQTSSSYYPPGSPIVMQFLTDLQAAGELSNIQEVSFCSKPLCCANVTTVSASGRSSPDLQCMANPTPAQCALYLDSIALTSDPSGVQGGTVCP